MEYDITPTPFLRQVADVFVENEIDSLSEYCFITPNKRSGIFLAKHFAESMHDNGHPGLLPAIMPISDFISDNIDKVEATRIEQLMILYTVYSEVLHQNSTPEEIAAGKDLVDFNRFQYWGDILLSDFNDVDRYMVDAKMLFKNVENLKEINANFLTPEQIEVIKRYWNEDLVPEPVKEFWKHAVHTADGDSNGKKNVAGFIRLWQVMHEVYSLFRNRLEQLGYTYSGKSYRDVAEKLHSAEPEDFEYKKYIFVGFNVLSKSEREIFDAMKRMGIADFYWDMASPAFKIEGNRGSKFIKKNIHDFPSYYKEIGTETIDYYPHIHIISIPSTIGQAKLMPLIINKLHPEIFIEGYLESLSENDFNDTMSAMVDTAIVLPDESLIHPILTSMSRRVESINVTMGYSLRHTNVASLMRSIVSLQLRARESASDNTFFRDDVIAVLSHPLIRLHFNDLCDDIVKYINENRLFNIPISELNKAEFGKLKPIFSVVTNANDPEAVLNYLSELFDWLIHLLCLRLDYDGNIEVVELATDYDDDRTDESQAKRDASGLPVLEIQYVKAYIDALDELKGLRKRYLSQLFLEDKTIFHLVERIVANQTVSYDGVPLEGLQAMGFLESRCLDFDNIIITSANERILPRKHYAKSFIPNALRAGYGMSTIEHQESMYAYYFYRLISRAKIVYLLYDSRTGGVRSGGPSRFIKQIQYQFPSDHVHVWTSKYHMSEADKPTISIAKTPEIMAILEQFRTPDKTKARYLSASSINEFINCPLQFYLAHIERYYPEDEIVDYMDESTYGTIIHDTVQQLYDEEKGIENQVEITQSLLDKLSDEDRISAKVEYFIRKHYLKKDPQLKTPLPGDAQVYRKIMVLSIKTMFERERSLESSRFYVAGETGDKIRLRVSDRHNINFTYRIDRIDRIDDNGTTRFRLIDYKTGGDNLDNRKFDNVFIEPKFGSRDKAILQLLLYAKAFAQESGFDGVIQPYIYSFRKFGRDPLKPLNIDGRIAEDYRDFDEEFTRRIDEVLDGIFDPDKPFVANPGKHSCKYCKFKQFCQVGENQ